MYHITEGIIITTLSVYLPNISKNLRLISTMTGKKPIFVIKANAYGIGAIKVAKYVEKDVSAFAVSHISEGISLRENGIILPIMVLMPPNEKDAAKYEKYSLQPSISSFSHVKYFAKVHVFVNIALNVGMNRFGITSESEFIKVIDFCHSNGIEINSVFSHMSQCNDAVEVIKFDKMTANYPFERHLFCSYGEEKYCDDVKSLVRVGLLPYGITDKSCFECAIKLESEIVFLRRMKKGDKLSYGGTFEAKREMTVAVIPFGYADGFSRNYKNVSFRYKDKTVKVIGATCMDVCFCDVTGSDASIGDKVVIIENASDVFALASSRGIAPHEVLTSLSERVERVYLE